MTGTSDQKMRLKMDCQQSDEGMWLLDYIAIAIAAIQTMF